MSKLKCTSVSKQSWNNETSVFENEDFKVVVTLKNPRNHGIVNVGDEIPFEVKNPKPAAKKPAAKKVAAKKPAAKKVAAKKVAAKEVAKAETPTV